jgi:hypothetical protein
MTSTALVPVMDMQVLNICQQLKEDSIDKKYRQSIASIRATISNISIEGAISILEAFNYANNNFHNKFVHNGNRWNIKDLTVDQYFPEYQGRMAHETMIFWFWGGPPHKQRWYRGTLQTFLEDRILYEISMKGIAAIVKIIGTDLEAINVPTHSTTKIIGC